MRGGNNKMVHEMTGGRMDYDQTALKTEALWTRYTLLIAGTGTMQGQNGARTSRILYPGSVQPRSEVCIIAE
jgi:hypothetical protein